MLHFDLPVIDLSSGAEARISVLSEGILAICNLSVINLMYNCWGANAEAMDSLKITCPVNMETKNNMVTAYMTDLLN